MWLANTVADIDINWWLLWKQIGWIDIVFVLVFTIGIFLGLKRGLGKVLPRVVGIVTAQTIAQEYYGVFSMFVHERVPLPKLLIEIFFFVALVFLAFLFVELCLQVLGLLAKLEFKTFVSAVGGALLSGFGSILLLGLLSSFILFFPFQTIRSSFESRSLSGPSLAKLTEQIHGRFSGLIPSAWRSE
jgi:uncharacterized membrane protein required for colicin V production